MSNVLFKEVMLPDHPGTADEESLIILIAPLQLFLLLCFILHIFAFANTSRLLIKHPYAVCFLLRSSHLLSGCVFFPLHSMQDELFPVYPSAYVPYISGKGERK